MKRFLLIFFSILLIPTFIYSQGRADESEPEIGLIQEYQINPGDRLEISVFGEPELKTIARVSAQGYISYPFIGRIRAAGFTVEELAERIQIKLGEEYLVDPHVNVFIKDYAKFFVSGAVRNEGAYELDSAYALSDVIAMAGGAGENADLEKITVIREGEEGRERIYVDLEIQGDLFEIKPFDRIIVDKYGKIGVFGQVRSPGRYYVRRGLTVVDAIAEAGGFTDLASQNKVEVIRKEDGESRTIRVPVGTILRGARTSENIFLRKGDTIRVPERFF